ncbi:MAG: flagellar basal body P-ring formation chaperone FlgA [Gammaproteobacteria bacterium]
MAFCWPLNGLAQPQWQDLVELQRAAEAFARAHATALPGRAQIEALPLAPHTRLARCESLQTVLPPGERLWGDTSVIVRCVRPRAWSVFVPVSVKVFAEAVVTAHPIARGQVLTAADLSQGEQELTKWPTGPIVDPEQAIGKVAVVPLPARAALHADMLRAPYAVAEGQRVRVVFQGDGFRATSAGRSLGNAAVGETVRVRTASGKVVKGVAHSPGVVEVK